MPRNVAFLHLAMIVDGKQIADQIADSVTRDIVACGRTPRLAVIACAPNFATKRFLDIKRARAADVGVEVVLTELAAQSTTDEAVRAVRTAIAACDGVIVQLPFPAHIDARAVLGAIPYGWDVDAIGSEAQHKLHTGSTDVLPPVVGAIRAIAEVHQLTFSGRRVVVIGEGRLVGKPAAEWMRHQGAEVVTVTKETADLTAQTRAADVLVLGAGVPGLIVPDMIQDGVAVFDAGTSEDAGKLVGDADPACAEKSALFTPVPGGIGPITVSIIFANLLTLMRECAAERRV